MPNSDSNRDKIIIAAKEILSTEPKGIRTGELVRRRIKKQQPDIELGLPAIHQHLLAYARHPDADIYQPSRGWFRHKKFQETAPQHSPQAPAEKNEQAFYQPFADWLVQNLEECTKAITVGGNMLKDRFGTPDVVGVLKPSDTDYFKFPVEIVSAEIKVSADGVITAFGQACSYRLFSHKCYIVVPKTAPEEEIGKLESLCLIFGIGLILFDTASSTSPNFEIRTRAVRHDPDMFYVNQKIQPIAKKLLN